VTAFQPTGTCTATQSVLCGDFLNQYIATPGEVQSAVINVEHDLKKTVDLTPFNLDPDATYPDPNSNFQDPLFDPRFADDLIFGGLGNVDLGSYPRRSGTAEPEPAGGRAARDRWQLPPRWCGRRRHGGSRGPPDAYNQLIDGTGDICGEAGCVYLVRSTG
jgi:hypothetical protein